MAGASRRRCSGTPCHEVRRGAIDRAQGFWPPARGGGVTCAGLRAPFSERHHRLAGLSMISCVQPWACHVGSRVASRGSVACELTSSLTLGPTWAASWDMPGDVPEASAPAGPSVCVFA